MNEIGQEERGRMYAALVKSYKSGWTPFEAGALFCGYWPDTYFDGEEIEKGLAWFGGLDTCEEIKTAEQWFSEKRQWLDEQFLNQESPIVALFDALKSKDALFLLEGLAKSEWTGYEACHYLSGCSPYLQEASCDSFSIRDFDAEQHEKLNDFQDVDKTLREVMKGGVGNNFSAEFFGHRAPNKFNRSKDGMALAHPVDCFRAFSREVLEPQAFKPFIFQIADEIEGGAEPSAPSVQIDDLQSFWAQTPSPSVADMDAYSSSDSGDCKGKLDLPNVPTLFDGTEVVRGITVGQLRGLLDEKNEGTTFCPRLLASIRVELELNAMRAQVKAPNNFTFVYRKSEGDCRKELIEKHCKELRIFNCKDSDAKKRSGNRTVTPLDTNAITRVLAHGRELNDGRKKKS